MVLMSVSMPLGEKSCGDLNSKLKWYYQDIVRRSKAGGLVVYYTVESNVGALPDNIQIYDLQVDYSRGCMSAEKATVAGTYNIPYTYKIFKEQSNIPDPATHKLLAEGKIYLQIRVLPPVIQNDKLIAFVSYRDENGPPQIYVMSTDGNRMSRASTLSGIFPTWSPDGTRLYFVNNLGDTDGIYYVPLKSPSIPNPVQISKEGDFITISPDGKQLAYSKGDEIYITDSDGKDSPHFLTSGHKPVWSPNGKMIAYLSKEGEEVEISVINTDGIGGLRLTTNAGEYSEFAWSPDSKQISYIADEYSGVLYVIKADGTGLLKLNSKKATLYSIPSDSSPSWSPDGNRIVFVRDSQIAVINSDGTGYKLLTDSRRASYFSAYYTIWSYRTPYWSSDGQYIFFVAQGDGTNIFRMNSDGSHIVNITFDDLATLLESALKP